jgi:hypothetical protein
MLKTGHFYSIHVIDYTKIFFKRIFILLIHFHFDISKTLSAGGSKSCFFTRQACLKCDNILIWENESYQRGMV